MEQVFEFIAARWAAFNGWAEQPLTNGTMLFVFLGFFYTILAINRLHNALSAIHRLLYKQVNGNYPTFDLLS
jgi:hypothetical protein